MWWLAMLPRHYLISLDFELDFCYVAHWCLISHLWLPLKSNSCSDLRHQSRHHLTLFRLHLLSKSSFDWQTCNFSIRLSHQSWKLHRLPHYSRNTGLVWMILHKLLTNIKLEYHLCLNVSFWAGFPLRQCCMITYLCWRDVEYHSNKHTVIREWLLLKNVCIISC